MAPIRHRWNLRVRPALLAAVTMAWVLQAPLTSTPAAAQWLATTSKQSSEVQPFQAVPAAIEKLQEDALAAFNQGEMSKALGLQEELMAWVKANLPEVHPFRATALNNLGIYLSGMGQWAEALPPTLESVRIYSELAKTNSDFLSDLASALSNLGIRYSELGQPAESLTPIQEAIKIYRKQAKTRSASLPDLAGSLNNLGVTYSELVSRPGNNR